MFFLDRERGWPWWAAVLAGLGAAIAFRGLVDVGVRRLIPWPSLFGVEDERTKEGDVVNRRRAWFWRTFYRRLLVLGTLIGLPVWAVVHYAGASVLLRVAALGILLPVYMIFNFAILFGPLMLVGIKTL